MNKLLKITSLLFLLYSSNIAFANSEPGPIAPVEEYKFENFSISIQSDALQELDFSAKNGNLLLSTNTEITFVQVLTDAGSLEYQLPVFSKSIIIDLDDLVKGDYRLNLIMAGEEMIPATFSKK